MNAITKLPRALRASAILALGAIFLAACSSTPTATPKPTASAPKVQNGGTLTVGIPNAPTALDPTTEGSLVGRIVFSNMCLSLFGVNSQMAVVPVLAASLPTVAAGGILYTIHLRPGVKFNDGTPLNAQAVKISLERDKTFPTSARAAVLKPITSISVVNSLTVQLHLSQPDAPLTSILAARSGIVMSPTALAKEGANFSQNPVCVGPYAFKSRPSLDQVILTRSHYFYGGAPHIQTLIFDAITNPSTCYSDLLSGAINLAGPGCLPPNDYTLLTKNPAYKTAQLTSNGYQGLDINVSNGAGSLKPAATANNPLATHAQLREALALTINRQTINTVVFGGTNVVGCGPISPSSVYHTKLPCPTPNITEAKKLVQESGVPTPINLTLMVPTGTLNVEQGEIIASNAKAAGFNITVQPTEFTTALATAQAGNYQLFDIGWSGRVDPDQNIAPFYTQGSAFDYTGQGPAAMMQLVAEARATTNVAARKALYFKAEKMMLQNNSIIYLFHLTNQIAYPTSVVGVSFTPDGMLHLGSAGIAIS
ncbi:MAG: ABC transporter substrate-binding protein [Candidatus Dormibacteria bacterium]